MSLQLQVSISALERFSKRLGRSSLFQVLKDMTQSEAFLLLSWLCNNTVFKTCKKFYMQQEVLLQNELCCDSLITWNETLIKKIPHIS